MPLTLLSRSLYPIGRRAMASRVDVRYKSFCLGALELVRRQSETVRAINLDWPWLPDDDEGDLDSASDVSVTEVHAGLVHRLFGAVCSTLRTLVVEVRVDSSYELESFVEMMDKLPEPRTLKRASFKLLVNIGSEERRAFGYEEPEVPSAVLSAIRFFGTGLEELELWVQSIECDWHELWDEDEWWDEVELARVMPRSLRVLKARALPGPFIGTLARASSETLELLRVEDILRPDEEPPRPLAFLIGRPLMALRVLKIRAPDIKATGFVNFPATQLVDFDEGIPGDRVLDALAPTTRMLRFELEPMYFGRVPSLIRRLANPAWLPQLAVISLDYIESIVTGQPDVYGSVPSSQIPRVVRRFHRDVKALVKAASERSVRVDHRNLRAAWP